MQVCEKRERVISRATSNYYTYPTIISHESRLSKIIWGRKANEEKDEASCQGYYNVRKVW